jgi:Methyltransferase domain
LIRREDLAWSEGDRSFSLRGWRFATVHGGGESGGLPPGERCFLFYKDRALVEQYLAYFASLAEPVRCDHLVELGLYDGGSVPFWFETFEPHKHLGIDIREGKDTPYFEKYASQEGRRGRIEIHWGTSQADPIRVGRLVDEAFAGEPLDVVIDDASHLYAESRASFELLFPRLRPTGLYIIEDWAWFHWRGEERNFAGRKPLTQLIFDLVEALGSNSHRLILNVHLSSGFAAIRRGWSSRAELEPLCLDRAIYRHPR